MKRGSVRQMVAAGLLALFARPEVASAAPASADETIAFELYRLENASTRLPPATEDKLRAVLREAYAALGENPRAPASRAEFLAFAERVSVAMARHNLIQPVERADWVDSLGEALQPVSASHPRLASYLVHPQNAARLSHVDRSKPFFFVDCDMGALILMSVAQMVGFELALVEVPNHNFVRWDDGRGGHVNWDWTNWAEHPNERYVVSHGISEAQLLRRTFLGSQSLRESRGYFLGVMTINLSDPAEILRLRRMAIADAPHNPTTANNVAWSFATVADGVTDSERRTAVALSLSALASRPSDANYMDTLACAYAAAGKRELGAAIEQEAIRAAGTDADSYRRNLARIRNGELCR